MNSAPHSGEPGTRRSALKLLAAAATGGLAVRAIGADAPSSSVAPAGAISLGSSSEYFNAADSSLPHGGVRSANSGMENSAAIEALFARVRAAKPDRAYVQMPAGVLRFARTLSPSGQEPGIGQRADFIRIEFPNTRIVADGPGENFMPIQLCDDSGTFKDMDNFANSGGTGARQVPWSKSLDTIWIENDERGTLKKMRTLFNARNAEGLHLSGDLTLDCRRVPRLVGLASTGGGRGRTGMFRGLIDNLRIENADVGIMAGNFGASPNNSGIADHFTDVTIGMLELRRGVKVGFVGHSNHFDNLTVAKLNLVCPHNSYLCNTHNMVIGSGFINVPTGTVSRRGLVLFGTNVRICTLYFNSGGGILSDGHILVGERAVLDIQYHNDISKATTTGCHLAMGRVPSGVPCRRASLVARVDIRSAQGVKRPAPDQNPGMLWIDTEGGLDCRRQVELHLAADRADYDIVKIGGAGTTNDKITLYDVRDDEHYGKTRRIVDGKLALWA